MKLKVERLLSNSFSNYLIDIPFPNSFKWRKFDITEPYEELMNRLTDIINWLNDECKGWLICGLWKKGEIKD